jgi:diaminopimelate decarboxylase
MTAIEKKKLYEKPVIVKHQTGLNNKFGRASGNQVCTEIDGVRVSDLMQEFGSPLYVISETGIRRQLRDFQRTFSSRYPSVSLGWSYKTNYLEAVCRIMHQQGSLAEVVSGMEFRLARLSGIPADRIIYNGPHKDDESLRDALKGGSKIHIDNVEELIRIEALALEAGYDSNNRFPVAIRVNMQLDAQHWDRFGFNLESGRAHEVVRRISESESLQIAGLHTHIGTYVDDVEIYRQAARKMVELAVWIKKHIGVHISWWDLGGGFATRNTLHWAYQSGEVSCPRLVQYAEAICPVLASLPLAPGEELPHLFFETGRAMVDESMHMIVTVLAERRLADGTRALVLDAGVNLLSSTTWYKYEVLPAEASPSMIYEETTLLGNLCMQIDVLRKGCPLPPVLSGQQLVVRNIGAYNLSQSTQFIHGRPAVVLIDTNNQTHLVRKPEDAATWRTNDLVPEHLMDLKI